MSDQMFNSYKYPLHPNKEVKEQLIQWLGASRWVYNHFLELNVKQHKETGKYIYYAEMCKILTELKKSDELLWLNDVYSQSLQQTLKQLDLAIKAKTEVNKAKLAKGEEVKHWYPKFRAKFFNDDSIVIPQFFSIKKHFLKLPKIDKVISFSKNIPFKGKINQLIIKKENEQLFLILQCEQKNVEKIEQGNNYIGIDIGVARTYTRSDGKFFPKMDFPKEERRIKQLQRELERRSKREKNGKLEKKQSVRRSITRTKLRKAYKHLKNKRLDTLQKKTTFLVKKFDVIVVEDLNVKNMTKSAKGTKERPGKNVGQKKGLNRAILGACWGLMFNLLEYKTKKRGKIFLKVDPKHTSQICSKCGYKDKKNRKSQSKFKCLKCEMKMNADKNGAINILNRGLKELGLINPQKVSFSQTRIFNMLK
jgi:putative transposase